MSNFVKKINNISEDDLKVLEKEFVKMKFGKFFVFVSILSCILCVIGLILAVFQAVVHAKDLDIDKYQLIFDFGSMCMETGGSGVFLYLFVYMIMLPMFDLKKSEKNNKNINKNKLEISKSDRSLLLRNIFFVLALLWLFSFIYNIGFFVGRFLAS